MHYTHILICACSSRSFMDATKIAHMAAILKNKGLKVILEPDLCKQVMQKGAATEHITTSVVLACYPRAVQSLFDTLGKQPQKVLDIRNNSIDTLLNQLQLTSPSDQEKIEGEEELLAEIRSFPVDKGSDAWYPVVDKERCSECEKCHDFCLFGVYAVEDGQVRVKQPQQCKNNCPACARVCPSQAIIFPKYEKSPINGGLEAEEQAMSLDPKALYASALRMRLDQRRASVSLLKKDNR